MTKRSVIYEPPANEVLDHFAHAVGQELGGEYAEWDVESGFADFMKTVAQITANNLNRKTSSEFDTGIE